MHSIVPLSLKYSFWVFLSLKIEGQLKGQLRDKGTLYGQKMIKFKK